MNKNETRPAVGAAGREGEAEGLVGSTTSEDDYMGSFGFCQRGAVSSCLGRGKAAAIPGRQLVEALGLKDLRALTQLVELERQSGTPICAVVAGADRGYFLPAEADELWRYRCSLARRLRSITRTYMAIDGAYSGLVGQEVIEGWNSGGGVDWENPYRERDDSPELARKGGAHNGGC